MPTPKIRDLFTNRMRNVRGGPLTPMPESSIHIPLVARIERCKVDGLLFFHVPNGLWTTEKGGARLRQMGLKPGMVDLVFAMPLRVLCLELKNETGVLSEEQIDVRREVIAAGWGWAMRRDLDSATELLIECGFIRAGCV